MSLTEDWKSEKLKKGWYYCRLKNGLIHHFEFNSKDFTDLTCHTAPVAEVFAPCDYAEIATFYAYYKEAQRMCSDYMKKNTRLESDNRKFRQLLKELQYYIVNTPVLEQGSEQKTKQIHNLLTRINEVLR